MGDKWEGKRTFTFGTWNVRGLTEKKKETFSEIVKENHDVVVLTETKLRGSGKEEYANYIHVYSGVRVGVARAGVSVLIKKEHARYMRWKVISERIIRVRLKVFNQKIIILGVYWVDESSKPELKDRFQTLLSRTIKDIKLADELIILGDLNAWVGTCETSKIIGKYGENKLNNNGRRLLELCDMYRLKIQNTFFSHADMHKYTWYDSRSQSKSIIDYCISRQTTSLMFIDVIACRWLECGTDHAYLQAVSIFPSAPVITQNLCKYNSFLLFSKSIDLQYKNHLDNSIILGNDKYAIDLYKHFKESINSAALKVLGFSSQNKKSQFLWDEELHSLFSLRNVNCKISETDASLDNNNILNPAVKNEVWEGVCKTIDNIPNQLQKSKTIWSLLEEFKSQVDTTMTNDKELIEIYFKNCFKENRSQFENDRSDISGKPEFTVFPADILQALNEFKDDDLPSPGGISMRLIKHGSDKLKKLLQFLIQAIFNGQQIPDEMNETFFIYQPGDEKQSNNLSDFKYVPHAVMQIMSTIIKNCIEKSNHFNEKCRIIHEETRLNATFVLRLLIQKCIERQNKPLHLAFINLEEIFMGVPRIQIFHELHKLGIEEGLIAIIKHLYTNNSMRIIFPDGNSKTFPVTKGLKKECHLSPILFQIYVRRAVKEWQRDNDKKGFSLDNFKFFSLISQTNLVVACDTSKHLGAAIESLLKQFEKLHLQIGFKNIKYLAIVEDGDKELIIGRKTITSDDSFEFMGSVLEVVGRNEMDISDRIIITKKAIGVLHPVARDKLVTTENKKRIFHAFIENCLTFGCETWTLTEKFMECLQKVEMNYWKWCVEKYPHRYNREDICTLVDIKESVKDTVKLKRSAWYAKVKLMPQHKWPKLLLEWNAEGKRKPGRRKKWIEGIEEFINDLKLNENIVIKNRHLENIIAYNQEIQETSSDVE